MIKTTGMKKIPVVLFLAMITTLLTSFGPILVNAASSTVPKFNDLFKPTFKIGVKGNDIKTLQQFLKDQGYYSGKIDGKYGKMTAGAVNGFKANNNIIQTKIPVTNSQFPVTILTPKDGETYKAGDTMNITWQVSKNVGSNDTFVVSADPQWQSADYPNEYGFSSPVLSSNVRSYSWTIPDPLPQHNNPYPFRVNVGFCQQSPTGEKQVLVDGAYSSCENNYSNSVFNIKIISSNKSNETSTTSVPVNN